MLKRFIRRILGTESFPLKRSEPLDRIEPQTPDPVKGRLPRPQPTTPPAPTLPQE